MAIVKTEILSIRQFLCNTNLQIPHFQRPYKWSIKNAIQLLEDMQRFNTTKSYRIGTIVIHKENDKYNIVDGQQRTLTFILIVKALYKLKLIKNKELQQQLKTTHDTAFQPKFKNDTSKKNIKENYLEIERRIFSMDESTIDFFLNKCEITHFVIDLSLIHI